MKEYLEPKKCKMILRPSKLGNSYGFYIPKRMMILEEHYMYEIEIKRLDQ